MSRDRCPRFRYSTSDGSVKQHMAASQQATVAELREQVRQLQQELREAEQKTALGELVGTTTHEFNNVLTTILNYAKLGLRHPDEPTRTKALTKILSAGERAARLTNSVLGLARNRGNEATPTPLPTLIDDSLVLLEREMQKYRIAIETSYETQRPAMIVGNQIQQVLLNLLTNARQAMPQGGRILLRVAEDSARGTIDLTLRDTGQGIPPDVLPRIFDRYFSTKSGPDETGKGGAGVGLAACREIIEAHGGKIRVESTIGVGTAFTLKLPAAKAEQLAGPAGKPIAQLGVGGAAHPSAASA
ncbi:sensor histidine kinase [Botrimarina hoheduenensis]|nr:ATP-binding protein [Botrimarina hoheduenensis]